MRYCTVMCVLYVLHVVVLCVETILLYAVLCHHHGLPRVQVTHISTAKHACAPSKGGAYLIATMKGWDVCTSLVWPMYISPTHISTYAIIVEACIYDKELKTGIL